MPLDQKDLDAISAIVAKQLQPVKEEIVSIKSDVQALKVDVKSIKDDIKVMKEDLNLLARLNQLDDIRKEPRLRKLYSTDDQMEA